MHAVEQMMSTTPNKGSADKRSLSQCIDLCVQCELACVACADACLGETAALEMLRKCIRLDLDCADLCGTTARVLSRLYEPDPQILGATLEACARACASCAAECHKHQADHAHCGICADACDKCEAACRDMLRQVGVARA